MIQSPAMSWLLINFVSAFLLPPLNLLLLAAAGVALLKHRPRLGKSLVVAALVLLYLVSTPYFSVAALRMLESAPADPLARPADAIVVLGGGTYFNAPEYGGDTVNEYTLERLRYAAQLHRKSGKPILVAGGRPLGNATSEAAQMRAALEEGFQVPVVWLEETSDNTFENARYSYPILRKAGVSRIYLVTHAWHVKRAALAFAAAGFEVVPAPTRYATRHRLSVLDFLPQAGALHDSKIFMKEVIGIAWYRLKFGAYWY